MEKERKKLLDDIIKLVKKEPTKTIDLASSSFSQEELDYLTEHNVISSYISYNRSGLFYDSVKCIGLRLVYDGGNE